MVERNLAKVEVAGSNPVVRSTPIVVTLNEATQIKPAGVLTLGDYWGPPPIIPDDQSRTELGELVYRAKDLDNPDAAQKLAARFITLAEHLPLDLGGEVETGSEVEAMDKIVIDKIVVVEVPSRASLSETLASALASAIAVPHLPGLVECETQTQRFRDVPPQERKSVAHKANFRVNADIKGKNIVLVDDVVLTGTTFTAVTKCLFDAGAATVTPVAAARTRRS